MTDWQSLALVLVAIYLSECAWWIGRASLVVARRGRSARIASASAWLGNEQGGLVLMDPLPPWEAAFVCHWPPLFISPQGLAVPDQDLPSGSQRMDLPRCCVAFEALGQIQAVDRQIRINGREFAHAADEASARYWCALIGRLKSLPEEQRGPAVIQAMRDATDLDAIRRRLADHERGSTGLRWVGHLLFALMTVAVVGMLWLQPLRAWWPQMLLGLLGLIAAAAILFERAHRRLYPQETGQRWQSVAILVLTPTAAIRAWQRLGRDLLADFHPLAVAAALCRPEELAPFARRVLLALGHPASGSQMPSGSPAESIARFSRQHWHMALEAMLRAAQMDPAALTAPPAAGDGQCRSYCPRCDTQYVVAEGVCSDCGGIPLRSLDQAPAGVNAGAAASAAESAVASRRTSGS